ncbi:MAG: hypothetical protein CUN55_18860, partial [Phototrophicales bacterium]
RILSKFGVIYEPTISRIELSCRHRWLIIASDGLWDHFQQNEIISIIDDYEKKYAQDEINAAHCKLLAEHLVKLVKEGQKDNKGLDNITIIVVYLRVMRKSKGKHESREKTSSTERKANRRPS